MLEFHVDIRYQLHIKLRSEVIEISIFQLFGHFLLPWMSVICNSSETSWSKIKILFCIDLCNPVFFHRYILGIIHFQRLHHVLSRALWHFSEFIFAIVCAIFLPYVCNISAISLSHTDFCTWYSNSGDVSKANKSGKRFPQFGYFLILLQTACTVFITIIWRYFTQSSLPLKELTLFTASSSSKSKFVIIIIIVVVIIIIIIIIIAIIYGRMSWHSQCGCLCLMCGSPCLLTEIEHGGRKYYLDFLGIFIGS